MKINNNIKYKLPKYNAPDSTWKNIETILDEIDKQASDATLKNKLPVHNAPEIFKQIHKNNTPGINLNVFKIAASVALIIGLSTGALLHFINKETITYSLEYKTEDKRNSTIPNANDNKEFNYILAQNCKTQPKVCSKPEYENLQNQLNAIETEIKNLNQALATYKDPNLEKHLLRLINDKVKIEKYLLMLFN